MDIREFAYRKNFNELTEEQRIFTAKRIVKDIERIAKKKNISEETAYDFYINGSVYLTF